MKKFFSGFTTPPYDGFIRSALEKEMDKGRSGENERPLSSPFHIDSKP
jgi:hypothetical protein